MKMILNKRKLLKYSVFPHSSLLNRQQFYITIIILKERERSATRMKRQIRSEKVMTVVICKVERNENYREFFFSLIAYGVQEQERFIF